jgi:hypothetical protein
MAQYRYRDLDHVINCLDRRRMIIRHNDFGWFLVAIWVFVLIMYMRRAFRS